MKTFATLCTALFLPAAVQILSAQERQVDPVSLQQISDHVYQINGGSGANGGLIVCETGLVVIDSKMDESSVKQSLEAIRAISGKPILYLVNTHSDGDHIQGNRFFPQGITVVAHENCRADFFKENFGRPSDWGEEAFYPFTPSLTFTDHLTLWLGQDRIDLQYFGRGHTSGDIVVTLPGEKVAFIGDLFFAGRPQLIHSVKEGDSFQYVKTLTGILESVDAETYISGHSAPVGKEELIAHIAGVEKRQQKVKELMEAGMDLEAVLGEFEESEARLVTSMVEEIGGQ
ncbi:MAG: MBL fold metallo-hydrolase [Bacteroidales bacterium]